MSQLWNWLDGFHLRKKQQTLHQALYQQLQYAIEQGLLKAGDKLPTHRELATRLSIAVATVTKVYKAAESAGLLNAKVGKGSFVSACPVLPQAIKANDLQCINLSIIKPQVNIANQQITQQLKSLSEQNQLSELMDYNVAGGSLTDHQAATHWLLSQGVLINSKQVSLCSGAQHGLMVLISTLTDYGDCIAVESLCYPGIISLANQFGRKLIPLEMDEEGITPESLEQACQQYGIKLLIVVASHQNPTASIMSVKRRKDIAQIVTKHKVWMIDDDVYGFLNPELPALSNFVPEYGFYLSSLSKSIFPGLRVGFIVYPEAFKQRIEATIRNTIWMPVSLTLALASKLIFSGQALVIQKQQRDIAIQRQIIAKRILKGEQLSSQINSFHLWLTLPSPWTSDKFSQVLEERGVLVSSADYFRVSHINNNQQINEIKSHKVNKDEAVRISLMAAKSEDELIFALKILKRLLTKN